jgi:hypothetical protein
MEALDDGRGTRLVRIDGSVVGQLPPPTDHDQPAVVVTLDPRACADADECPGQTLAQRSHRCIDMLRRKALHTTWAADMQIAFRGARLDGSSTIRDQRLSAYRQARVVVGRSGAVETSLDDHAGIRREQRRRLSDTNRHFVPSASFTRPVRDRIPDALLFASTGGS